MTRFLSDDAKSKNKETKLVEEVQQKIIELNEEKLGKLKERVLDIEPVISDNKKEGQTTKTVVEKQSAESKESLKDDVISKKGIII